MVQAVKEVPEGEAAGKIKSVYEDIKSTLRTPVVPLPFRALAVHPDYLQVAWIALKPNVQTVFFETRADELRAFAVRSLSGAAAESSSGTPAPARAALDVFHYLNPKSLLAVAALRSAANGQQPRLAELTRDEKRQVAPGIPADAHLPDLVDPAEASGPVADLFRQIEAVFPAPAVPGEYQALAAWPDYLREEWEAIQRLMSMPEYGQVMRQLRSMTDETVVALPYRMDTNPHVLRQSGLSERDLDEVHRTLDTYYYLLPGLVAGTALLSARSDGPEAASRSPYPLATA